MGTFFLYLARFLSSVIDAGSADSNFMTLCQYNYLGLLIGLFVNLRSWIFLLGTEVLKFLLFFFFRNPLAQMEEEKREHAMKLKKMEAEMEQVFESKVKEKKQKLKESEADVRSQSCFTFIFLSVILSELWILKLFFFHDLPAKHTEK